MAGPTRLGDQQRLRTRAAVATLVGVLILSTDALLVRLIPGSALTVVFWRGALMALGLGIVAATQRRAIDVRAMLRPDLATMAAAALCAGSMLCFVGAIKATTVANALVIVATVPLAAAILARIFLGERVRRATWFAIAGALAGMAIIFARDLGGGDLLGNLLALATTVFFGGYLTLLRSGRVASAWAALTHAGVASALFAALFAADLAVPISSLPYVGLLGLVVIPLASVLISIGPRGLPAAEVGLIMLLETIFGSLWAWLVLGEAPSQEAIVGGTIVIASLALRALQGRA